MSVLNPEIRRRSRISTDRTTTDKVFAVETVGDIHFLWATTGQLAANGTTTIYLTVDGQPSSPNVFSRTPQVQVWRSVATLVRGGQPTGPSATDYSLLSTGITHTVGWAAANGIFTVGITMGSTASDCLIVATGV